MQQRQPRLGDILDDYCPRERRLTNHAVVAMIGEDVRLTRCTTCDSEHDYRHARVPRVRRKNDIAIAHPPGGGGPVPKRVAHDAPPPAAVAGSPDAMPAASGSEPQFDELPDAVSASDAPADAADDFGNRIEPPVVEEGPVHRQLIRAQLPKIDGQPASSRQAPDFTIRQPTGRPGRFRPRHQRAAFQGPSDRSHSAGYAGGNSRSGARPASPPPFGARNGDRQGGRKHSK